MTVIAWDGKHLVADSRATYGNSPDSTYTLDCHNKIFRTRNSKCTHKGSKIKWVAYCGSVTPMDMLATYILEHKGELDELPTWPQIIKPNGDVFLLLENGSLLRVYYKLLKRTHHITFNTIRVDPDEVRIYGSGSDFKSVTNLFKLTDARDVGLVIAQLSESCGGEVLYVTADSNDISTHLTIDESLHEPMREALQDICSGKLLNLI